MSDDPGKLCVYYSRRSRRRRDDDLTLVSVPRHPQTTLFARRRKTAFCILHFRTSGCGSAISIPSRRRQATGPSEAYRARHPQQDSRAGSLTAAMFWPSSSSAAKGTFRYARVPAFALGSSPSPRGSRGPSRGSRHPRLFVPLRDFSRVVRRHGTRAASSRLDATTRAHPRAVGRRASVSSRPPRTPVAGFSASPRRVSASSSPRSRRCRSKTRNPARKSTTPPARARLYVSTSTRRSARGT